MGPTVGTNRTDALDSLLAQTNWTTDNNFVIPTLIKGLTRLTKGNPGKVILNKEWWTP